jgi:hypothetical protein
MSGFEDVSNEVKQNTKAQNRTLAMTAVLAAQGARTNGLLRQQIDLQVDSLRLQDFSARVSLQSLAVNEQMLEQLGRLGDDMKATADRARKEMLADQLNAELVKVERALEKLEASGDLLGLIVASYRVKEQLLGSGITAAAFTSKADMREFEDLQDRASSLVEKYQDSIEDLLSYSALMSSVAKLEEIIAENRVRCEQLVQEEEELKARKEELERGYEEIRKGIRRPLAGIPLGVFVVGTVLAATETALILGVLLGFGAVVTGLITGIKRRISYRKVKDREAELFGIQTKSVGELKAKFREVVESIDKRLGEIATEISALTEAIHEDEQRYFGGIAAGKEIVKNNPHPEIKLPAIETSLGKTE